MAEELDFKSEDLEPVEDKELGSDLEEITGKVENELGYQYVLNIKEGEKLDENDIEPQYIYMLIPIEEFEEGGKIEDIEHKSEEINKEESIPQQSSPVQTATAFPLESKESDLELISEQNDTVTSPNTATDEVPDKPMGPETDELPETLEEEDPGLEEIGDEFTQEELTDFINQSEMEVKFYIDEDTEFNLEEVLDYLKLYPESDIFMKVENQEEFEEKLENFFGEIDKVEGQVESEDQNVMVDQGGKKMNLSSKDETPIKQPPQNESFSIFNFKGKNIPDGIYVGDIINENLYGRLDIELTKNTLTIDKKIFNLKEEVDIDKSLNKEKIDLVLKEEDSVKFREFLKEKSDIRIKL